MVSWLKKIRPQWSASTNAAAAGVAVQVAAGSQGQKVLDKGGKPIPAWLAAVRAQWVSLSAREKLLLKIAIPLLLGALVWWVGLAPALATLRQTSKDQAELDSKIAQMQVWAVEVKKLQGNGVGGNNTAALQDSAQLRSLCAGKAEPSASAAVPIGADSIAVHKIDAPTLAQCLSQLPVLAAKLDKKQGLWSGSLQLRPAQP